MQGDTDLYIQLYNMFIYRKHTVQGIIYNNHYNYHFYIYLYIIMVEDIIIIILIIYHGDDKIDNVNIAI